jgi:hypothetical protein
LTVPAVGPGDYPLNLIVGSAMVSTGASISVGN